jgi:hypothetical protein
MKRLPVTLIKCSQRTVDPLLHWYLLACRLLSMPCHLYLCAPPLTPCSGHWGVPAHPGQAGRHVCEAPGKELPGTGAGNRGQLFKLLFRLTQQLCTSSVNDAGLWLLSCSLARSLPPETVACIILCLCDALMGLGTHRPAAPLSPGWLREQTQGGWTGRMRPQSSCSVQRMPRRQH